MATGRERKRFKGYLAALTPDARQVLASSAEKGADLVLYDAETGTPVRTFRADRAEGASADVASLALSPDGRYAFTSGYDKVGRLWDVKAGKELRRCEGEFVAEEAAFSADGRLVLAGAYLFDVATGKLRHCFADNAPGVYGAALSPDGRRALAGCTDNTVRLWDVATGQEIHCFRGHTYYVRGVAFAPDGRTALSCSWDNTMRLWRLPE